MKHWHQSNRILLNHWLGVLLTKNRPTTTMLVVVWCWWHNNHTSLESSWLDGCNMIWVRSRNWGCLVTWFCYQLIAAVPWPHPYPYTRSIICCITLQSQWSQHGGCWWPGKISTSEWESKFDSLSQTMDIIDRVTYISHVIKTFRQTSNINTPLVGNKLVSWDVVGAPPVGVAPTTSSFST